jgi:two-component system chemotaxis sensor kinase CheA
MAQGMLELERTSTPELVQKLFRYAHTLKGAARVVKQKEIAELAHAIEDVLTVFRDGTAQPTPDRVNAVLELLDSISGQMTKLGQSAQEPSAPSPPPLPRSSVPAPEQPLPRPPVRASAVAAASSAPVDDSFRTLRADVEEMDALIDGVAEAHVQMEGLRRRHSRLERLRLLQEQLTAELRAVSSGRALAIASELGSGLSTFEGAFGAGIEQVDRELRQVREAAERLRLLPVGLVWWVLERAARDTAATAGKKVELETHGGQVRLDAHVLSAVQPALVQLVRNGIAHGIEREGDRISAGKPGAGKVTLEVIRRGNRVSFVCADDGKGVDLEAVRREAVKKGLLAADVRAESAALMDLLMHGGISTALEVTSHSGRGVGLDLVRETALKLGGDVRVDSQPGRGTRFELEVPVSLASMEAVLVECDQQLAAIPLESVRSSVRVRADEIAHTADGESLVLEGKVIPFAPLAHSLSNGVRPPAQLRKAWSAVVVESGGLLAALGVDRLRGTENVVLRSLPRPCPAGAVVAGATLDAEGNPRLVLDPQALVADARRASASLRGAAAGPLPLLVVDDSLTTRMLEQSILESAGYSVELASSAEEALVKLGERQYALALVDVEMPGMNGFELLERLRSEPRLAEMPTILVTSLSSPEHKQRGQEAGARDYIVKGEFDQKRLLQRIRELVGR